MVQAANWKGGRLWSLENGNSGSVGGVAGLRWLSEQLNKRQRRTKNSRTGEGVQGDGPKAGPRTPSPRTILSNFRRPNDDGNGRLATGNCRQRPCKSGTNEHIDKLSFLHASPAELASLLVASLHRQFDCLPYIGVHSCGQPTSSKFAQFNLSVRICA